MSAGAMKLSWSGPKSNTDDTWSVSPSVALCFGVRDVASVLRWASYLFVIALFIWLQDRIWLQSSVVDDGVAHLPSLT